MKRAVFLPKAAWARLILAWLCGALSLEALAQRRVTFPPAESPPPPPAKTPPRTEAGGEDNGPMPCPGPTQRKTQDRVPPPPTTLTVMYKVRYGEKLQYVYPDGRVQDFEQWESYKNDGYQLVTHTSQRLGDGNNYQYGVQPLANANFDPVDIPLLYMTGDYDFTFTDAEAQSLARFLSQGGTILFNAARGQDEFSVAVLREMRRVAPRRNFMKIPPDHPIFNSRYRIKQVMTMINGVQSMQPPEVYTLDVGTRGAAILVRDGMGAAWSGDGYHPAGRHIVGESAIRLGVNIMAYVLGSTEYGRFLAQQFPRYDAATRPGDVVRFALARYAGSWDVNPALQNSLLKGLYDNTGIDVDFAPRVVDLGSSDILNYPLVIMTGHYDFEWSAAELEALRNYLLRGGMLFASAAAGFKPFDEAFRRELRKVFPDNALVPLPPTHPLFAGGWNPVERVEYTPAALRENPDLQYPEFYGLLIEGRVAVLYTPHDVFSAVNREANAYARGLVPEDALRVAINAYTHCLSH